MGVNRLTKGFFDVCVLGPEGVKSVVRHPGVLVAEGFQVANVFYVWNSLNP